MADNKLLLGNISFPSDIDNNLRLSLDELVIKLDDTMNYLFKPTVNTITATYTATDLDSVILCNATSGAITVNLPAAATVTGKVLTIKKTDVSGNAVTIDGDGSETIDGATTNVLSSQYDSVRIASDGTSWSVV